MMKALSITKRIHMGDDVDDDDPTAKLNSRIQTNFSSFLFFLFPNFGGLLEVSSQFVSLQVT
jgi:hypothetical protein